MIAGDLCMLIEALTNEFNSDEKEDIQRYMKYTIKDLGKEQILYNFLQFLEPVIK